MTPQAITDKERVAAADAFIRGRIQDLPTIGILTGTGLAEVAGRLADACGIHYEAIPYFPIPTVESHRGNLICGKLAGKFVAIMQGRFHLYEGYSPTEVVFPIRVLRTLGARSVVLLNAAGGLNPTFRPGDIMAITDHINLSGRNPLVGPNHPEWGIRFPDMSHVYDAEWIHRIHSLAAKSRLPLRRGVYAGLLGPSLETPAEIRFLRMIGADAVGFSTVPEAIAAVHAGMRILGLSIITNVHDPDNPRPTTLSAVLTAAAQATPKLTDLIEGIIENEPEI